ncbi:hypothetical protein EWE75_24050 [Sphingomonas populi]|uniref:Uncharacterized protein n=1 Tax=Sphingomonas populi TaxID=2484750 RepID=A0A4Q6XGJ0_9SPHN|nr:hypothetical protein [Sphingomonas populi]RZF59030.1 hypothetical protein EWE75_24050 [Sphingomonas populi]
MSKLTLSYRFDASFFDMSLTRDDFGYLSVHVETDRISAKGGFWVQWQDVKEFGEALGLFPIGENQPVVAQWGFDMQEGDDLKLRLEVVPADKRGNLFLKFEVADDDEPEDRARGRFLMNYPDVDAFRREIARLMKNEVEEAVLNGR